MGMIARGEGVYQQGKEELPVCVHGRRVEYLAVASARAATREKHGKCALLVRFRRGFHGDRR